MSEAWPQLPLASWADTKDTIHRFAQIVGKTRLAASPYRNHWWNVPFYVTGDGITTSPMWDGELMFEARFDFVDHDLMIEASDGGVALFDLPGLTVAQFYAAWMEGLSDLGIEVAPADPTPFDLADDVPFAEDHRGTYDRDAVLTYWQLLVRADQLLKAFAGGWKGKTSPVHHFWHTFDIAVTRFSGREAPPIPGADAVTREAYSHECVSFGFWFGDAQFPAPAFYSYTSPSPDGLAAWPLEGPGARWVERSGSPLAVLPYDEVRESGDPAGEVLAFLESAWQAGATLAAFP